MDAKSPSKNNWLSSYVVVSTILIILIYLGVLLIRLMDPDAWGAYISVLRGGTLYSLPDRPALEMVFMKVMYMGENYVLLPLSILNIILGSIALKRGAVNRTIGIIGIVIGALRPFLYVLIFFYLLYVIISGGQIY